MYMCDTDNLLRYMTEKMTQSVSSLVWAYKTCVACTGFNFVLALIQWRVCDEVWSTQARLAVSMQEQNVVDYTV